MLGLTWRNPGLVAPVIAFAYYYESHHPERVPGLLPRVSTIPREPGYRVEDWTWEARRVRSSVRWGQ